ncbi:uncharacterized protein L199_003544 [Kwoniella botswanensis]|uniref:uncharacterized protein n=1 Tax=Kwoniella botswanensis TaxID=1268659 RepID=UPI00315DD191
MSTETTRSLDRGDLTESNYTMISNCHCPSSAPNIEFLLISLVDHFSDKLVLIACFQIASLLWISWIYKVKLNDYSWRWRHQQYRTLVDLTDILLYIVSTTVFILQFRLLCILWQYDNTRYIPIQLVSFGVLRYALKQSSKHSKDIYLHDIVGDTFTINPNRQRQRQRVGSDSSSNSHSESSTSSRSIVESNSTSIPPSPNGSSVTSPIDSPSSSISGLPSPAEEEYDDSIPPSHNMARLREIAKRENVSLWWVFFREERNWVRMRMNNNQSIFFSQRERAPARERKIAAIAQERDRD